MQKSFVFLFLSLLLPLKLFAQAEAVEQRSYTRGYMIAVDSRDHAACNRAEERLKLIAPQSHQKLCANSREFPISIAVISIPSSEWDFTTEINLAKGKKDILTQRASGFAKSGASGIMFFMPVGRDHDNLLRLTTKRSHSQVTVIRVDDQRILSSGDGISMSVSFMLETLPRRFAARIADITQRLESRLSVEPGTAGKDTSVLAMLTLGLGGSNTTSNGAEPAPAPGFDFNFFLPESECLRMNSCGREEEKGLFGTGILTGLGVAFTYRF